MDTAKSVVNELLRLIVCRLFFCTALIAGDALADITVLTGATLYDGSGAPPLANAVVVVRDNRIADIGPVDRVPIPSGAGVTDLRGKWILPGLVDAHVHFFQSGGLYTRPDVIDLQNVRPYDVEIATIRRQLPATLTRYIRSGVTSVVDLAGPAWTYELRRLADDAAASPRVALAGPGLAPALRPGLDGEHAPAVVVRTPEHARRAVQLLAADRPDLLKIWFVLSPNMNPQREFRWVYAAIDEAHKRGLRVAVHATKLQLAHEMVRAGADILVHSIDDELIEPELLSLMRARGVIYIPTLGVGRRYAEVLGQQLVLSPFEQAMADGDVIASFDDLRRLTRGRASKRSLPDNRIANENLRRVYRAGVQIAAGSDAGNIGSLHGPGLHRELELMVEAGLTPVQVLQSATRNAAAVMGRGNELGRLQPGMLADLLVLDSNPLADIRNTEDIVVVMKGGQIVHCDAKALPAGCPD